MNHDIIIQDIYNINIYDMEAVISFINSKEFWIYHGFVLSGLWVLASAFAIFIKKYSTILHVLSFAIIDFTTLFFAGAALYRVSANIQNFMQWSILKQGHVTGGCLFLVLMILQHLGGVKAFITGKPNPQHRKFGKVLALIGRCIAGVGWVLGGHMNNAMIVGGATITLLVLSALSSSKGVSQADDGSRVRSKSPKGKRQ